MTKKIVNTGGAHLSFPVPGKKFSIKKQGVVAPGATLPLTERQTASESVRKLIKDGTLSSEGDAVRNATGAYQSFPTDWKVIESKKQIEVAPGGSAFVTDEQAASPVVRKLVEDSGIDCDDSEESVEGVGYTVTLDKSVYNLSGSATLGIKATVTGEGELTADDKAGWEADSKSNRLEFVSASWNKGVCTLKLKRGDGASLKSFTDEVAIKKDGATFATAKVEVVPVVSVSLDPSDKLVTSDAAAVTAIKVNGVAVEQQAVTMKAKNDVATVSMVGGAYVITPAKEGAAEIELSDKSGSYKLSIAFAAPACSIGGVYYKTVAAALKAAKSGDEIVLAKDIEESVSFTGQSPRAKGFELAIDLNGHVWSGAPTSIHTLRVDYGTVTVKDSKGGGEVKYGKDYAFIVSHLAGDYESVLVLDVPDSTKFTGKTSVAQCGQPGGSGSNLKYYGGELVIKGGEFVAVPDTNEQYDANGNFKYLLNMLDMVESRYAGGIYSPSSISVQGGTFRKFDPADCAAEGAGTDFVAQGFASVKQGDSYKVVAE